MHLILAKFKGDVKLFLSRARNVASMFDLINSKYFRILHKSKTKHTFRSNHKCINCGGGGLGHDELHKIDTT